MVRYISEEGLAQLKVELETLKQNRQEIAKRLEDAKALGDLSENAEYQQAREAQAFNEGRILELEDIIMDSQVIVKSASHDMVLVGSTVTLEANGEKIKYTIVGSEESDPALGKISNRSPLGQACLNKKKNDSFQVETPKGVTKYKVLNIE